MYLQDQSLNKTENSIRLADTLLPYLPYKFMARIQLLTTNGISCPVALREKQVKSLILSECFIFK